MIVPYKEISSEALTALIEEFITREGTDYGDYDFSLHDKVQQVREQLQRKEVVVVYDPSLESVSLLPRLEAEQRERLESHDIG